MKINRALYWPTSASCDPTPFLSAINDPPYPEGNLWSCELRTTANIPYVLLVMVALPVYVKGEGVPKFFVFDNFGLRFSRDSEWFLLPCYIGTVSISSLGESTIH